MTSSSPCPRASPAHRRSPSRPAGTRPACPSASSSSGGRGRTIGCSRRRACWRPSPGDAQYAGAVHLGLAAIVVSEYDPAIRFFVDALGFELVEDSPALTNDGRPKRWVVVRPPGAVTGLLLARADGEEQVAVVGRQAAGRVGFFL